MGNLCGTAAAFAAQGGGGASGAEAPPAAWQPPPVPAAGARRSTLRVPEDCPSLAAAVKAAAAGDRIAVAEGVYSETVFVDKALEIVGRGSPARVCLQAINASALTLARAPCRLENLTIRVRDVAGAAGGRGCACVDAGAGSRLLLEHCVLEGGRCGLQTSGTAVLVASEVRGSAETGVLGLAGSQVWMLRCSVHSHALSGIHLQVRARVLGGRGGSGASTACACADAAANNAVRAG